MVEISGLIKLFVFFWFFGIVRRTSFEQFKSREIACVEMDQWGALTTNASVVMTRDDMSIRRKTVIVSLVFNQLKYIVYAIAVLRKTFFHDSLAKIQSFRL